MNFSHTTRRLNSKLLRIIIAIAFLTGLFSSHSGRTESMKAQPTPNTAQQTTTSSPSPTYQLLSPDEVGQRQGYREMATLNASSNKSALHASGSFHGPIPGLEGYCWPLSASPGETILFYVSGRGSSSVRFLRHKANAAGSTSVFMGTATFAPTTQPTPDDADLNGARWRSSFSQTIPATWPSGIYSAELTDLSGNQSHVTFIVKPSPSRHSTIAVFANINTWLAYNCWKGKGKYCNKSARVSFMRPNPEASPIEGALHLTRGELWILSWLEDEGYRPDVYTDLDFHNGIPSGYTHLVLSTHPEYWTTRMYDNLKAFLDRGGSLLYLGGNGIYENAEYNFTSSDNGMVFRVGVDDGPRYPAFFRLLRSEGPVRRRPERSILGVATERCAVESAPYQVLGECHPLFRGTGLRNGDTFGDRGLNIGFSTGKAAGWEVDSSSGPGAIGIPCSGAEVESGCGCASDCEPNLTGKGGCPAVLPSTLPPGLTILARGQNWPMSAPPAKRSGAEMIYYRHPGGGFVFSVGSITFGGSLVVDRNIQQIVRNALSPSTDRIPAVTELGEGSRIARFRWMPPIRRLSGEMLYRINLNRVIITHVCDVNWYRINLPRYFHDPFGRAACNPQITVTFSSGIKITRVEGTRDNPYRDLESFTSSPAEIRRIFFTPDQLFFRVQPNPTRGYNLRFEFLAPSEGLCRLPPGPGD